MARRWLLAARGWLLPIRSPMPLRATANSQPRAADRERSRQTTSDATAHPPARHDYCRVFGGHSVRTPPLSTERRGGRSRDVPSSYRHRPRGRARPHAGYEHGIRDRRPVGPGTRRWRSHRGHACRERHEELARERQGDRAFRRSRHARADYGLMRCPECPRSGLAAYSIRTAGQPDCAPSPAESSSSPSSIQGVRCRISVRSWSSTWRACAGS